MSTKNVSVNHKFNLPSWEDSADVTQLTENWQKLDTTLFPLGGVYTGDMNELVLPGQYRVQSNVNLPNNKAYYGQVFVGRSVVSGGNNDTVSQLAISYSNRQMWYRGALLRNGVWTWEEWSTIYSTGNKPTPAEIGAVPTGFGIAETAKDISGTDLVNTLKIAKGGFYKGAEVTNAPTTTDWYFFEVISHSNVHSTVMAYKLWDKNIYHASYINGVLSDWYEMYSTFRKPTTNEIGAESLSGGTAIPSNANLDTYRTQGNYHCPGDAIAQSLSNCPVTNAFRLKVGHPTGAEAYIYQELFNWVTGTRYYRQCISSSDVWTNWQTTYDTYKKPTPAEIGASPSGHGHALTDSVITGVLPITKGGTGASDVPTARTKLNFISGTYTGTGDSGSGSYMYNYDTGARGSNIIFISNAVAKGFLTPQGGAMFSDQGALGSSNYKVFGGNAEEKAYYSNGYIQLRTAHNFINSQGGNFTYWCL